MSNEEIVSWIWTSLLGRDVMKNAKILKNIYGSIVNARNECEKGKCFTGLGVDKKLLNKLRNKAIYNQAEKIFEKCIRNNIKVITLDSANYPQNLKNIYSPPCVLYYKGILKNNFNNNTSDFSENYISIVGSRRCTSYGKTISFDFAKKLSSFGIGIVSGMARGIDSEAHKGALWANGYTIAVLGCGVDVIYPKESIKLYDEIIEKGCIISEFIPGTPPNKHNFPARNRIVAGLSKGVLVVEAAMKSGAMITVDMALEQGKNVYVIPGNINSEASAGCNELIKNGAICITEVKDILVDYGICIDDFVKADTDKIQLLNNMISENEKLIVNAIVNGFNFADDISKATNINISETLSALTLLEIKGILLKDFDGFYKLLI